MKKENTRARLRVKVFESWAKSIELVDSYGWVKYSPGDIAVIKKYLP